MILVTIWQNILEVSTVKADTAVKYITMVVCLRVLYYSYYVAFPAINLQLLIGSKSNLW